MSIIDKGLKIRLYIFLKPTNKKEWQNTQMGEFHNQAINRGGNLND